MTHGDKDNIKCPHCRKPNRLPIEPARGEILERELPCDHCGKKVYYWLRWSVTVEAETSEKAK
jgi:DNA-directed RNA polymerase subunit RPC12/RpoP